MTRPTAETLAAEARDATLASILADTTTWDLRVVKRAVLAAARNAPDGAFSANTFRHLLPEQGRGYVGAALRALARGRLIQQTGQYVPSTLPSTHGHRIAVYRLAQANTGTEVAA